MNPNQSEWYVELKILIVDTIQFASGLGLNLILEPDKKIGSNQDYSWFGLIRSIDTPVKRLENIHSLFSKVSFPALFF